MSQQGVPSHPLQSSQQQQSGMAPLPPLLHPQKLQEIIVTTTGHAERLDGPVEMALNRIAEEFLDELVTLSADMAAHRSSAVIEPADILHPLEQFYGLSVANAGWIDLESRPKVTDLHLKPQQTGTDAHQARRVQVQRTRGAASGGAISGSK